MKTVSFYTLGCRLNQSETVVIERSFAERGYRVVDVRQPADVAVINTCTVTERGEADTRKLLHRLRRINPRVRVALIGCQAQIQKEALARWPNVCWVVGNARKMDLVSLIEEDGSTTPRVVTPTIARQRFTVPGAGVDPRHTRANLKIQDGCDFFCSFCEIPYARGRARSRVFEDILREARALAGAGHQEVVLTGVNIATYRDNGRDIVDIVEALEQIAPLKRIRISSVEPTTIPWRLVRKMSRAGKLCRYLHIPLQSGSATVLRAMKRRYRPGEFADFIRKVAAEVPEICLGTDVIVGFPAEDDKAFAETLRFLSEQPLHYAHVFRYSPRRLARSPSGEDHPARHVIQARAGQIRAISARKKREFYRRFVGTVRRVLFEQRKKDHWTGLTDNYVRVNVKTDQPLSNTFRDVRLDAVDDQNEVWGTLRADRRNQGKGWPSDDVQ